MSLWSLRKKPGSELLDFSPMRLTFTWQLVSVLRQRQDLELVQCLLGSLVAGHFLVLLSPASSDVTSKAKVSGVLKVDGARCDR